MKLSRQLVLFCVERRKAWRLLAEQGRYRQPGIRARSVRCWPTSMRASLSKEELFERGEELFEERLLGPAAAKTA